MYRDSAPPNDNEQSITEVETLLGSKRVDTKRAKHIEACMPTTFAELRDGAPAYTAPATNNEKRGMGAITAFAIFASASAAAAIVLISIFANKEPKTVEPDLTISSPAPVVPVVPGVAGHSHGKA